MLHYLELCLVYALSVLLASRIVPGLWVKSYGKAVLFAFVFGILDALLFKVLIILTLPFLFLTFGLSLFVLNALLFWLANRIVSGVQVSGFGSALLGSLVSGMINFILTYLIFGRGILFGV